MGKKTAPTANVTVTAIPKRWCSTEEACKYLGVSSDFIANLRKSAKLAYSKVGRMCFYEVKDIDRLIIKNRVI